MNKRILVFLLLVLTLLVCFASCKGKNTEAGTPTADLSTDPAPDATTTEEPPATEPPTVEIVKPELPAYTPPADASVYDASKGADTSWYTGDKTEYTLTSANQLVGFHSMRSADFTYEGITIKLGCDMILNEGTLNEILSRAESDSTSILAWKQLNSAYQFKGTFDGQGHTVSGLYLQTTSSAVRAMFGGVGGNATIKNFTLTNTYYGAPTTGVSKSSIGGLVAKVHTGTNLTISDVTVSAYMMETDQTFSRMGGLIASADTASNVLLKNCTFNGFIQISGSHAGAMIAYACNKDLNVTLENCTNNGNIYASSNAGGMIGYVAAKTFNDTNCVNNGIVYSPQNAGDIVGTKAILFDPNNGARPTAPEGTTALRVMSFNVQGTLTSESGVPDAAATNRINAVKQEILFYEPDLLGLQEDTMRWLSYLDLKDYNRIVDSSLSGSEMCAIYYKKGLKLLDSGSCWITNDGTRNSVALTIADITTDGSKYRLADEDLAFYKITKDSPDSVLTADIPYTTKDGKESTYYILGPRKMTWGVFDINGQIVIYVNTHLQHRSQNNIYSNEHYQNFRSMERIKSFDILQAQLAELKKEYPNAVNFLTGDFNDNVGTAIYNAATVEYGYSSSHIIATEKYGPDGSWNNAFDLTVQGDCHPKNESKEATTAAYLDYCFVSDGIDVLKFRVGDGKATITATDGSTKTIYTSDHLPIITDLCFKTSKTGSPIDPNYKEEEDDLSQPSVYSGIVDTKWYTGNKTEYVLTTADQLMGMMNLRSETVTFEGVTIKLARDMIINQGSLEEIMNLKENGGTVYDWRQLNSNYLFKGTFDGQGHTISGVYMQTTTSLQRGMFGGVGGNAVIKNFTLTNSYFATPTKGVNKTNFGCIAAKVSGTDATVTISNVTVQNTLMKECNTITSAGGFVGYVDGGKLTLDNCAFNGTLDLANSNNVGGFVGSTSPLASLTVYDNCSVNATITCNNTKGTYLGSDPDYALVEKPAA